MNSAGLDRFFFLHIPKTAGTSLHRMLAEVAGPYLHLQQPHELYWPAAAVWSRFRGCGGHTTWAGAERRGYTRGFTMTFLRNPTDRLLSQYSFSQMQEHGGRTEAIMAQTSELKRLLRACAGRFGAFWNAQTYALSGLSESERRPEKHLASALENLEKINFLGTVENFREDAGELIRLLGGPPSANVAHENRTKCKLQTAELDGETKALLDETQAMDALLYRRALELRRATRKIGPPLARSAVLAGWPTPEVSGTHEAEILHVEISATRGGPLISGDFAEILVFWKAAKPLTKVALGIQIEDCIGNLIAGTNTLLLTQRLMDLPAGTAQGGFKFALTMGAGRYLVNVALHRDSERLCWVTAAAKFEVQTPPTPYREGAVNLIAQACVQPQATDRSLPLASSQLIFLHVEEIAGYKRISGEFNLPVQVENHSDYILSSQPTCRLFASYHWLALGPCEAVFEGVRTSFPRSLWPSEHLLLDVKILPPPSSGKWRLQLRLIQEEVRWHEGPGFDRAMPGDILVDYQVD